MSEAHASAPASVTLQPASPLDELRSPAFQRLLQQCIHCGLCLQACPTYSVFGSEADSPRGRIALVSAASTGRIELNGVFREHIDLCLGCRACETACPSGVQYGLILEGAQTTLQRARIPGRLERFIRWLALRQFLPHTNRLRLMARLLRVYQRLGLQRLVRSLGILPSPLRVMEGLLPPLPASYRDYRQPAPAVGQKRGQVAFFYGCVQEAFLASINEATIRVLQRNGYEVHFPLDQTCCGAASLHLGETDGAHALARRNIDAFERYEAEHGAFLAIINNAGGCGAALKEYARELAADPDYAEKAARFSARVLDISEFLAGHLHHPPQGVLRRRVTYADSCHLRHAQKVVRQPRDLLRLIPGLELVELERTDRCCGSAGVYNILQPQTAQAVLAEKMADIARTGAGVVVATNTGCHFQLLSGARQSASPLQVVHLVELLDESYRLAEEQ